MIPLKDNIPTRTTPIVNYFLIGACALVFLAQLQDPGGELIERFGMVPARLSQPGERVVLHPSDRIADGVRIAARL